MKNIKNKGKKTRERARQYSGEYGECKGEKKTDKQWRKRSHIRRRKMKGRKAEKRKKMHKNGGKE